MSTIKGTITWKDLKQNHATSRFKGAAGKTLTDVTTLKTALAAMSACHVRAEGFVEKNYFGVDGAGAIDDKAIVTASDGDGDVHKWAISGYNGTPQQDNDGYIMADADRTAAIAAIAAFTGLTLSALRSPVIITL
jgi:hypothetical protein